MNNDNSNNNNYNNKHSTTTTTTSKKLTSTIKHYANIHKQYHTSNTNNKLSIIGET